MIIIAVALLTFAAVRILYSFKSSKWKEIWIVWIDGLIVSILATLIVVGFGYTFKRALYDYFQRSKVSLATTCSRDSKNTRKSVYVCNFVLRNETESELTGYPLTLNSSRSFSNFTFVSCKPNTEVSDRLTSTTKSDGESSCFFKVDLGPFETTNMTLKIVGDETNEPDPNILQ